LVASLFSSFLLIFYFAWLFIQTEGMMDIHHASVDKWQQNLKTYSECSTNFSLAVYSCGG